MKRKEITQNLSERLINYINPKRDGRVIMAREVTFDSETNHAVRVDYLMFRQKNSTVSGIEKGDVFCYEVKSSVTDFHSPHGHNFLGDYNYYVMPQEVYEEIKEEIPWKIGVLVPNSFEGFYTLKSIKTAKRCERERPVSEILFVMFRSVLRDYYQGVPVK